jgi:hypothetical protein
LVQIVRRVVTLVACLVTFVLVAATPTALADAYDRVFADYQQDGRIDPCAYSEADLRAARSQLPNDIEDFAPDFPPALDDALEPPARAACGDEAGGDAANPNGGAAPADGAPEQGAPAPGAPAEPVPGAAPAPPGTANPADPAKDGAIVRAGARSADRGSEAPAPLIALAVLGALLALVLLAWAIARWLAFEPAWWTRWRHAVAEAGWHVSGTWENFTDWLRRGRTAA